MGNHVGAQGLAHVGPQWDLRKMYSWSGCGTEVDIFVAMPYHSKSLLVWRSIFKIL